MKECALSPILGQPEGAEATLSEAFKKKKAGLARKMEERSADRAQAAAAGARKPEGMSDVISSWKRKRGVTSAKKTAAASSSATSQKSSGSDTTSEVRTTSSADRKKAEKERKERTARFVLNAFQSAKVVVVVV